MSHRCLATVVTAIALVSFSAVPAVSQTATAGTWTVPLTSWGDPDLQGQWNSQTSTPLQRPREGLLAGRDTLGVEEAETLCQGRNKIRPDGGGKPDHLAAGSCV